jgi:hypothetical protein
MKTLSMMIRILLLLIMVWPVAGLAQSDEEINARVDDLVHKHYMDGIPYEQAHALGPDALPYLFELLNNPDEKLFWTNVVVTIGFIEDPSAVEPLIAILEETEGDVDGATFRALISVPYALGCIAAGGDDRAIGYLGDNIAEPLNRNLKWNFRGKPVAEVIAEQSVMGLAVSGRPEARQRLKAMQAETARKGVQETRRFRTDTVPQGLMLMDRIDARGRAAVLNPHRGE